VAEPRDSNPWQQVFDRIGGQNRQSNAREALDLPGRAARERLVELNRLDEPASGPSQPCQNVKADARILFRERSLYPVPETVLRDSSGLIHIVSWA
jgi:hypothetical protein